MMWKWVIVAALGLIAIVGSVTYYGSRALAPAPLSIYQPYATTTLERALPAQLTPTSSVILSTSTSELGNATGSSATSSPRRETPAVEAGVLNNSN